VDAFEDVMAIRKNIETILGKHMAVSAMLADAPIVRAGGKIPLIIQPKARAGTAAREASSVIEAYQLSR
jgi:hypothetical protein